jgi:hypothetical protein
MRRAIVVAMAILAFPGLVGAGTINDFGGGKTEAVAILGAPGFSETVNLSIPAECAVLSATVNITGMAADGNASAFPTGVELTLNGSVLWAFNGTGFGSLGRQDTFLDGRTAFEAAFGGEGGGQETGFLIPQSARVKNASVDIDCRGPQSLLELANFTGPGRGYSFFGSSVASGDFNGDGYDDIVVGAPSDDAAGIISGSAYIYFGGPSVDSAPDIVLKGAAFLDYFGGSVADAGDVNSDGWHDVIVGAPQNNSAAPHAGRAYIFFGGPGIDATPDILLDGDAADDFFGGSVSGAGDVNGDGYGDVIVGASHNDAGAQDAGRAYIFFGGKAMDNRSDINLTGAGYMDSFGGSLSGAGDLNGDGYDDVIVGAAYSSGGTGPGTAYVYFGGSQMDAKADVTFAGENPDDRFGWEVSGAGDVNSDGYADVLVGAPFNGETAWRAGAAYVYFGGSYMDAYADITLRGTNRSARLGHSVCGAGDVNRDGYGDIILGAPYDWSACQTTGEALVFFGGGSMDAAPDIVITGAAANDSLGFSVGGGGDINGDGWADLIVGVPYSDIGGADKGQARLFSRAPFLTRPEILLGPTLLWSGPEHFAGVKRTPNFAPLLNAYLHEKPALPADRFGNPMMEVSLRLNASGEGKATLQDLNITYDYTARVPHFAGELNSYIASHRDEKGPGGNISVPLQVLSASAGRVMLWDPNITVDEPPKLTRAVPTIYIDEDTARNGLLDLNNYFEDDYDTGPGLVFSVIEAASADIVNVTITDLHYLSVDALTGDANDNWTGALRVVLQCTDRRGLSTDSNAFDIVVRNVNDAPAFTSVPATEATGGLQYEYRLAAVDGDDDTLSFNLEKKPQNMTFDPKSGLMLWTPVSAGSHNVSAAVSDGILTTYQNFTILVTVLNKAPRFISAPTITATAMVLYVYEARAMDPDGDRLSYSLLVWPGGMSIDGLTGRIVWTPGSGDTGNVSAAIKVTDWKGGETRQEFVLTVHPFVKAKMTVSQPLPGKPVSGRYIFAGSVERGTLDVLGVQLRIDSGEWMNATGNSTWGLAIDTGRLGEGEHTLQVRACDASGFSDTVSVRFRVDNPQTGAGDMPILIGIIILAICAGAVALILHWRRRGPKHYDWG